MARARSKIHPPASPLMNMLYHHGVEDAIIILTHKAQSHLGKKKGSTVRIMFFNFSDATASWIMDCNTGAPQRTVLMPFLFTIYISDFQFTTCRLLKFSSIVGSINEYHDEECRGLIRELCHEVLQQSRDTR